MWEFASRSLFSSFDKLIMFGNKMLMRIFGPMRGRNRRMATNT
jgi:hypothetical protein